MPNYQKMYYRLFNAVSDAIAILQTAQNDMEETYVDWEPVILEIIPVQDNEEDE